MGTIADSQTNPLDGNNYFDDLGGVALHRLVGELHPLRALLALGVTKQDITDNPDAVVASMAKERKALMRRLRSTDMATDIREHLALLELCLDVVYTQDEDSATIDACEEYLRTTILALSLTMDEVKRYM